MEKSILSEFAKYSSLNVIGMLALSCYILADTFFVAQGIGAIGLTALNLAIPVYSVISAAGLMTGVGAATRFAISGSKTIFTQSLIFGFLISAVCFFCGLFLSPNIAFLLGASEDVFETTRSYLQILLLFAPLFITDSIISCFVRNDRNPRLSMIAMTCGTFTNILFDYIFIFPLDMGITGAALATGFSPFVSLVILSAHFLSKRSTLSLQKIRLSLKAALDICRLGISAFITEFSSGIVMLVYNMIILNISGDLGVAAYGIIANISLVIVSVFTGIAQGSQPLISRCYGRGDNRGALKVLKYAIIASTVFSIIFYSVSFIFTNEIICIFDRENIGALQDIAFSGFRIYFTSIIFAGINIQCASFFSSVDKSKYGFIISVLRAAALIIPVALTLSYFFKMTGVWLSITVTELAVSIIAFIFLLKNGVRISGKDYFK